MFKKEHLTDEALTLLAGGQLRQERKRLANEHLRECSKCKVRFQKTQQVHALLVGFSEEGLDHALRTQQGSAHGTAETHYRFPWAPISAVTVAALIVIVFFSQPKVIPEASASELLTHAVETETKAGRPSAFALRVRGTTCAHGRDGEAGITSEVSGPCGNAADLIHKTAWATGNPLSARTFLSWHDSLSDRHDQVIKKSTSLTIDTKTSVGIVREAALTMELTDYRAFSLDLTFDDLEEITIAEDTRPPLLIATSNSPDATRKLSTRYVDDPSDVLEVQAWQILQSLNADSGWEANVIRDGGRVIVKASVTNDQRKQEILSALRAYPQLQSDIKNEVASPDFLPTRGIEADAPALAQAWLQTQFSDSAARNEYTNTTLALSKNVLGRAFILDRLRGQRRSVDRCSCAKELSKLIRHEEDMLKIAQASLATALEPMLGNNQAASALLSYTDAQLLDQTLANLLMASSSETSPSYGDSLKIVMRLLL